MVMRNTSFARPLRHLPTSRTSPINAFSIFPAIQASALISWQGSAYIYSMAQMTFITGGARSGKSRYAQQLALERSDNPIYVATARIWDAEFQQRVDRHQQDRDGRWTVLEEEKWLSRLS